MITEQFGGIKKRAVLKKLRLVDSSYSIWDSSEWYEDYDIIQLYFREVKTGNKYIIIMGGDVCGDWEIGLFHIMTYYIFTMKNCRHVREVLN